MSEPRWLQAIRKSRGGPRLIAKYQGRPRAENEGERLPDFVHVTGYEYFRLDQPKPRCYVKCVGPPGAHVWPSPTDRVVLGEPPGRCARCGMDLTLGAISGPVGTDWSKACVPVSWWACDPLGHWLMLRGDVFEDEDGTITVNGVVENRGPYQPWWRGTITRGVWVGQAVSDPAPEPDEGDA